MECKKTTGIVWFIVGIVILVMSIFADSIGFGVSHGFGYKQIAGTIAGVIVTIVGLILMCKK